MNVEKGQGHPVIWNALGIAVLGLAAWQDGSLWQSGFCIGVAVSIAYTAIMEAL